MALGDPFEPVTVDSGSYTPQQLALKSRLAQAMQQLQQGTDISPIRSGWQGLARMANAALGGYDLGQIERQVTGGQAARASGIADQYSGAPSPGTGQGTGQASNGAAPAADDTLDKTLPRSVRTNNPGAIEYGPFAKAMGATGTDGRYAVFPDMATGYKAQDILLGHYASKGLNTVEGIVTKWAPPDVDNNSTGAYIASVSKSLGVKPDQPLPPDMIPKISEAMAAYEAGRPVPRSGAQAAPVRTADASGALPAVAGQAAPAAPASPAASPAALPSASPSPPAAPPAAPAAGAPGVTPLTPQNALSQLLSNDQIMVETRKLMGPDGFANAVRAISNPNDPTAQANGIKSIEEVRQRVIAKSDPTAIAGLQQAQDAAAEKRMELQAAQTGQANPVAVSQQQAAQDVKEKASNKAAGIAAADALTQIARIGDKIDTPMRMRTSSLNPLNQTTKMGTVGDVVGPYAMSADRVDASLGHINPYGASIPGVANVAGMMRNLAAAAGPENNTAQTAQSARDELQTDLANLKISVNRAAAASSTTGSLGQERAALLKLVGDATPSINVQDKAALKGQLDTATNRAFDALNHSIKNGGVSVQDVNASVPLVMIEKGVKGGTLTGDQWKPAMQALSEARDIIEKTPPEQQAAVSQQVAEALTKMGFNPANLLQTTTPFHGVGGQ